MAFLSIFSKLPSAVLGSFVASAILGQVSSAIAAGQRDAAAAALPLGWAGFASPMFGNVCKHNVQHIGNSRSGSSDKLCQRAHLAFLYLCSSPLELPLELPVELPLALPPLELPPPPRPASVHHGTVLTVSACATFVERTRLQSFACFRRARTRSAFALPLWRPRRARRRRVPRHR